MNVAFSVFGLSVESLEIPPGTCLRGHDHERPHLCFVGAGGFDELGRQGAACEAGTVRLSPAGDRHQLAFGRQPTRCLILEFEAPRALRPLRRLYTRDATIAANARRVLAEVHSPDPLARLAVEATAWELLAHLARRHKQGGADGAGWLGRVREQLHHGALPSPSLSELAVGAGVSPEHLARSFRLRFGVPVGVYARRVRAEKAAGAVLRTDRPLAEIALEAGFADQSHMTRSLTRSLGLPPSALRRLIRGRWSRIKNVLDATRRAR